MTVAERLYRWNTWYNQVPEDWRFQLILWPLIAAGAVNMVLSVAIKFPFGLLVLLGIMCFAFIRVPHALGWIAPAEAPAAGPSPAPTMQIAGANWIIDLNRRYEALPETQRFWTVPVILIVAGTINMLLTLGSGFPFGLIFLLALLAIVVIRAPYASGMLKLPAPPSTPAVEYNSPMATVVPHPARDAAPPIRLHEAPAVDPVSTHDDEPAD